MCWWYSVVVFALNIIFMYVLLYIDVNSMLVSWCFSCERRICVCVPPPPRHCFGCKIRNKQDGSQQHFLFNFYSSDIAQTQKMRTHVKYKLQQYWIDPLRFHRFTPFSPLHWFIVQNFCCYGNPQKSPSAGIYIISRYKHTFMDKCQICPCVSMPIWATQKKKSVHRRQQEGKNTHRNHLLNKEFPSFQLSNLLN